MSTITVRTLEKLYQSHEKIVMLTCYDATFANIMDECGVEILLIGDSLGMVLQGLPNTLAVTMAQMIYHVQCVVRGNQQAMIAVDMPFASFQQSPEIAFENAAKLMSAGAHIVKVEGGEYIRETIRFLTERGIPVCAHIGLTPQAVNQLGGYTVQGKTIDAEQQLFNDAKACQDAGASLILIEAIPAELAKSLTESLSVPTIGIGAGPDCSGQVLVMHDILGIGKKIPRFAKNFLEATGNIQDAVKAYVTAVKNGSFPEEKHSFKRPS